MSTLYVTEQGAIIKRKSEHLLVIKGRQLLMEIPGIKVDQIAVFGSVTVTTPVINYLLQNKKELVFLTLSGKYKGRLQGKYSKNIKLRLAQFAANSNSDFMLAFARAVVKGKIANSITLARRANRYKYSSEAADLIDQLTGCRKNLFIKAGSLSALLGFEGMAANINFKILRCFINKEFTFKKRVRRPPKDPFNALLSFGYTLLANSILSAINMAGLDPFIGYYHTEKYGRPALALDLMEEFRPAIVDALALRLINKRIIVPAHFYLSSGKCFLTNQGLKNYLTHYNLQLDKKIIYPLTGDRLSYRRILELQARLLGKVLTGEIAAYKAFRIR